MQLKDQLFFLKKARKSYIKSIAGNKDKQYTDKGLCNYFHLRQDVFFSEIPVLFNIYLKKAKDGEQYWFKPGLILPRLFWIQYAIFKIYYFLFWDWMKRQPEFCKHENNTTKK